MNRTLIAPIATLALAFTAATAVAEGLRVGAASVVITPPEGTPMAGYYHGRAAEGVHDDLHAKAIVLEVGGTKAALVSLDLITTPPEMVEEARREIDRTTGVPGQATMISATHTHTGPVLSGRGRRDDALGASAGPAKDYRDELPGKIALAVRQAEEKLTPATLKAATGSEESIAFNRRFHMTDGTVGWNPGKLNPRIIKPAGPIDPDVPVLYFESADGDPIACYVNYAVHLDNVGGPVISADLPYTLSRALAGYKGEGLVTVFTAGCCGDINHIDVHWSDPQKGLDNAHRMGTILAAEVLRTWPKLEPIDPGTLRIATETVDLPLPEVTEEDVERAREVSRRFEDGSAGDRPAFLEVVDAYKVLDVAARDGQPIRVEVQVIALADRVAWVSLPGEIFTELGLRIKQDSPFPMTVIAELANGSIGYIPSRRAYGQGNYEVVSARCAEGSGELLTDVAVRMLVELHGADGSPGDRAGDD